MSEEELKNELKKEIVNLCETNSSVMTYMECLMKSYEKLEQELDQYKNNWEELKKWLNKEKSIMLGEIGAHINIEIDNILNKMKELEEDK